MGGATPSSLTVWWNAPGATTCQAYRDTSPGGSFSTKVYDSNGTSFTDTGLVSSTTYWYKVKATNASSSSELSSPVSGTTLSVTGGTPPATPTGLNVTSTTSISVSLWWNASNGATTYQLYRNGSQVYSNSSTNYTDTGLASSTTYQYTVQATNSYGSSAPSSPPVSATTPPVRTGVPPATPTGLNVTSTTSISVSLSWNASTGATTYQLYRNGSQVYSNSSTNYTDTGLASSTTYQYTVQATNSYGSSAPSSPPVFWQQPRSLASRRQPPQG